MRVTLACALAVALMAGCEATQSGPGDDAARTTPQDQEQSSLFPFDREAERRPVRKLYGIFRRPQSRRESEIKTQVAADSLCSPAYGFGSAEHGMTIPRLTRIVLSEVGPRHDDALVVIPTTTDYLSVTLFSGGGGTCSRPLTRDGLMTALRLGPGSVATIFGMVGDDVASVDLVVDGRRERAQLGENGFALELPDAPNKTIGKVVLTHHDGSVTEFPTG